MRNGGRAARIPDEAERKLRMQRVRIGLTGLAFVFVLVLLAAALLSSAVVAPEHDVAGAPITVTTNVAREEEPREPLAELGVVPGNPGNAGPSNTTDPAPAPPPRP